MKREKINQMFDSDLGRQLNVIFTTSDNMAFIRYEEALSHTNEMVNNNPENFVDTTIIEWFPEY